MKQSRLLTRSMGLWLMTLLLVMLTSLTSRAAEAYAVYTASNTTLTFYFDNQKNSRTGTKYALNTGNNNPDWNKDLTSGSITRVVFDSSFAGARPTTTCSWFADMENIQSISGTQYFNTTEVTNMSYMFAYSGNNGMNLDLRFLKTENVKDMSGMFCNCFFPSINISGWNTANVTDMKEMFGWCYNLKNLDLSHFNTAKVTNMEGMFIESSNLETINVSGWNTANVTDMSIMFRECNALKNVDVSSFNTAKVTTMDRMFECCKKLQSLNVSNFNTAKVTNMEGMFDQCEVLTSLNVSNFNTANVTTMENMFRYCSNLSNLDVSNFNTAKVTTMWGMFAGCSGLTTLDLSNFNTAKVTHMEYMFSNCNNLTTIYAGTGWNTAAVTSYYSSDMFKNCTKIRGGKGTTYNASHVDKAYAHIDGGTSNPGYFTGAIEPYAVYTPSNTTLTFYRDANRSTRTGTTYDLNTGTNSPGWYKDNANKSITKVVFNSSFADARPTTTYMWFYDMTNLQSITGMNYLNTSETTSMNSMFLNCSKLTSIDVSKFNTAKVTSMANMFYGCNGLTSLDLSNFNTAKVTSMVHMFFYCTNLTTIYAGTGWSTNAVTSSSDMFQNCTKIRGSKGTTYDTSHLDATYAHIDGGTSNPGYLSDFSEPYVVYTSASTTLTFYYDTMHSTRPGNTYSLNTGSTSPAWYTEGISQNVTRVIFTSSFANARPTTTYRWFYDMNKLETITGMNYLNTSEVTNMSSMFRECNSLTSVDVSNFNTEKVTNLSYMFNNCFELTSLDLSNFNTAKVTNMSNMFKNCRELTTIYASSYWNTAAVTSSTDMFFGCTRIKGSKGTTYNASHVDKAYAHIDGGTSNPGYLSDKKEAYAVYTPSNKTLTFYFDANRSTRTGTTYSLNSGNNNPDWRNDGTSANVTKVVFNSSFTNARPQTTYRWFSDMSGLVSITGIKYLKTSEVTMMNYMFSGCGLESIDLTTFNTGNVTTMANMFYNCTKLTSVDLSNFDTEKVTSMSMMFSGCTALTKLDLSKLNTHNVKNMSSMFSGCSKLTTIYAGKDWDTEAVTSSSNMFRSCTKIRGSKGTTYDANHTDKAYAHIDGGKSNPGYLSTALKGDVNGDGEVTVADINDIIDAILGNPNPLADVDGDGEVSVADINEVINIILAGN